MKKLLLLILILILTLICCVACKESSGEVTPKPSADVTPEPEGTAEPSKEVIKGPIAYFSFDKLDESGNFYEEKSGLACESHGSPVQKEGRHGMSLSLDGASLLSFDMDLPLRNSAHSIAAWVRVDTAKLTNEAVIAGWGNYSPIKDTRLLFFGKCATVSSYGNSASYAIPSMEEWHHVVLAYGDDQYLLYVDGDLVSSYFTDGINIQETPLYIGGFNTGGSNAGTFGIHFAGEIDSLYVFDKKINKNEVLACMDNVKDFSSVASDPEGPDSEVVSQIGFTNYTGSISGSTYCSGFTYDYTVSIPKYTDIDEFALIVSFDNSAGPIAQVMANLYESGIAPPTVVIGISGGTYKATLSGGTNYEARPYSYDVFDDEYANFLVEEFIPAMTEKYNLRISDSPDWHMTSGGSSGGICAWNCVWFRNDYFHRVYMSSPTFSSMNKGYMPPILMRLYETKDIRGFMDYSESEPNEYFGDSYLAALSAESALRYAGYTFEYRYNKGEGHCSQLSSMKGLTEVMKYVWRDYDTVPVQAKRNTSYMNQVVSINNKWEATTEQMPTALRAVAANGVYTFEGGSIYYTPENGSSRKVASGFSTITSLAVSSDMWRLYIADADTASIYAMSITADGSLKDKFMLCSLHTLTDFKTPGAIALCVDSQDRIYAVTELGIQVIRNSGIINMIFENPGDGELTEIAFGGNGKNYLYVKSGDTVYKRKWNVSGRASETAVSAPATAGYY